MSARSYLNASPVSGRLGSMKVSIKRVYEKPDAADGFRRARRPVVAARREQGTRRSGRMAEGCRAERRVAQMVRPRAGAVRRVRQTVPQQNWRPVRRSVPSRPSSPTTRTSPWCTAPKTRSTTKRWSSAMCCRAPEAPHRSRPGGARCRVEHNGPMISAEHARALRDAGVAWVPVARRCLSSSTARSSTATPSL